MVKSRQWVSVSYQDFGFFLSEINCEHLIKVLICRFCDFFTTSKEQNFVLLDQINRKPKIRQYFHLIERVRGPFMEEKTISKGQILRVFCKAPK
jgi:hypothetical protein